MNLNILTSKLITPALICIALAGCGGGGSATPEDARQAPPRASIAITFDAHATTYPVAFPILQAHGLVGTYYVDPAAPSAKPSQLVELKRAGWSVGAYSGYNMVGVYRTKGPEAAKSALTEIMARTSDYAGFSVTALAPNQRAWSTDLANLATGLVSSVRVVDNFAQWQTLPVPNMLYVRDGGTPSLSVSDTADSLRATLSRLIAAGGLWTVVVHKVGDDADPAYSVSREALEALCAAAATERAAGRLAVITY